MKNRIEKLIQLMEKEEIENILITNPKNMYYFSGFYQGEGYLLIGRAGLILVTDSRYTQYAISACPDFKVEDISRVCVTDYISPDAPLGFEDEYVSYAFYKSISKKVNNLVCASELIRQIRRIKDGRETELIKAGVEISDNAFSQICQYIKRGMTEKQVAAQIDCLMKKNGAEASSFSTIVASGERGSLPHAIPSDKVLEEGDFVVMDFGALYEGYCSDMTRTVAIGRADEEKKKIYDTVLRAQLAALSEVKAGHTGAYVDSVARKIIDESYPGTFAHSLGHGVGLDIHESPNLSPKNHSELVASDVVTVEPGIYVPGLCGVRIEDMVVVSHQGCEILTRSPKELLILG